MASFKIKVCGMKYAANVAAIADLHPDYLGFIFYPKSPRSVDEVSAELIKYIPKEIKTVGVFVDEELEEVKTLVQQHQLKAVQLHGSESVAFCAEVRQLGIEVIKAFGVHADFNFEQLSPYQENVDYFLFDTQTPSHGGSGKVFDWTLLEKYVLNTPYFLSGGISSVHSQTLGDIKDDRFYAVDVNSKFELEPGLKDVEGLSKFLKELNDIA
jgi:phosphoribosylanthranilate isomerase